MRTYSEEEKEFLKHHSYIEDVIDGHHLRYILSGAENEQAMVECLRSYTQENIKISVH